MKNYYDILGVTTDASEPEIRNAYRKLVLIYHPDVSRSDTTEIISDIIEAYAVLSDPKKREEYDRTFKVTEYAKDEKVIQRNDSENLERELLRKKRALLKVIENKFSFFGLSIVDFRSIFKDVMDNDDNEILD